MATDQGLIPAKTQLRDHLMLQLICSEEFGYGTSDSPSADPLNRVDRRVADSKDILPEDIQLVNSK